MTASLTERLQREIQQLLSCWRRDPDLMSSAINDLREAIGPGTRGGLLTETLRSNLLAAAKDSEPKVRWAAARALGSAAGRNPAVVEAFLAAVKDSEPKVRSVRPGRLGPPGPEIRRWSRRCSPR